MPIIAHKPRRVLGVDPGSVKVGLAVVEDTPSVFPSRCLEMVVAMVGETDGIIRRLLDEWVPEAIVLGDRTRHGELLGVIREMGFATILVDEHMTTRLARDRYLRANPPKGLLRLVPMGLRTPPVPVDDYAAWILAERYLIGTVKDTPT